MHEIPPVRGEINVYDKSKQQKANSAPASKNYLYFASPFLLCHTSIGFDEMVQFKV